MKEIEESREGEREREIKLKSETDGVKGELSEDERMTILFFLFIPSRSPSLKEEVE